MNDQQRQRRHDERVQKDLLDGMARILEVLHDISDGIRELTHKVATPSLPPTPSEATPTPRLLSIAAAAKYIGIPVSALRNLQYAGKAPTITRVGTRIYFSVDDIHAWLAANRPEPRPATRPWRGSYMPGRIGSGIPSSSARDPQSWCDGSHHEPMAASKYTGRGVCRVCRDDVLVNADGRLRKHRRWRLW